MLFNRPSRDRDMRRQAIIDELGDLDPGDRSVRLDRAVAEGDVRPDDKDLLLRIAGRLDNLRIMIVPSAFHWPQNELIGVGSTGDTSRTIKLPATSNATDPVAIPIEAEADPAFLAAAQAEWTWPSIAWLRP